MGLEHAGRRVYTAVRTVASDDSATPTGDSPSGAVEVPDKARGSITHVLFHGDGSAASPSAIVTIFGLLAVAGEDMQGQTEFQTVWCVLAQLNSGAAVGATTKTPVAPAGNDIWYAESFAHLSLYKKLYAMVTSMTNLTDCDVQFVFESP